MSMDSGCTAAPRPGTSRGDSWTCQRRPTLSSRPKARSKERKGKGTCAVMEQPGAASPSCEQTKWDQWELQPRGVVPQLRAERQSYSKTTKSVVVFARSSRGAQVESSHVRYSAGTVAHSLFSLHSGPEVGLSPHWMLIVLDKVDVTWQCFSSNSSSGVCWTKT